MRTAPATAPVHYATTVPFPGVRRSAWFPVRCTTIDANLWITREPEAVTCKQCRRYAKLDISPTHERATP
jgi:hypothetical protein